MFNTLSAYHKGSYDHKFVFVAILEAAQDSFQQLDFDGSL